MDAWVFIEVETPMLTAPHPKARRDYLAPVACIIASSTRSRNRRKSQAILMIGGLDRYFQIVKCFRDEDLAPTANPNSPSRPRNVLPPARKTFSK